MTTPLTKIPNVPALEPKKYQSFGLNNVRKIPQVQEHMTEDQLHDLEVVAQVLPFKTNNYVVDELIQWENVPDDPMFVLTFPQRELLLPDDFDAMEAAYASGDKERIKKTAHEIRLHLNPHPAGQLEHNVPTLEDQKLQGMQHKYNETVLFFPTQGQTCHAYCTFCFRWPQFVGMDGMKFAMKEADLLVQYLQEHEEVSDVLFTGGDPMVMTPKFVRTYFNAILEADLPHVDTIRIGTKSLTYWPYKYVDEKEGDEIVQIFEEVVDAGKQLAIMAHFNHPVELSTPAVQTAIKRLRRAGAVIRSQTPLLRNINDDPAVWAEKWRREVNLGVIPYYMFVVRDTGAQHYFGVPLVRAWEIYRQAYKNVSGLARTVRGPSMSAGPGKIEMLGPADVKGERVMAFRFLQGRNPDWVDRVFFAEYDEDAIWIDECTPAFGEKQWFFEDEYPIVKSTPKDLVAQEDEEDESAVGFAGNGPAQG